MISVSENNDIVPHNSIIGKVVGIFEDKQSNHVNILVEYSNLDVEINDDEYNLGDILEIDLTVNKISKVS